MKHSIRTKLFLIFAGLLGVFVIAGALINALFLEQFYIYKNKEIFIDTSKQVESVLIMGEASIINTIEDIDQTDAISVAIADPSGIIKYASYPQKNKPGFNKLPKEVSDLIDSTSKDEVYSTVKNENGQSPKIIYISRTANGELIILKKQLKGVMESVSIANQFFIILGIVILFVGGIVIYIFSQRMVKPVLEMNEIANNISNLQFDKLFDIKSKDEIGELGASINIISKKLEASINSLKKDIEYQKQLARNITHELKTPIGVIKGYAEGLIYGVADDPETIREYCQTIALECDRMDNMVKELLELSALESKNIELNITQFEVCSLFSSIAERFQPIFIDKQIKCIFEFADGLQMCADFILIERALGNIIINAVRNSDENKYIKVSAKLEGDQTVISVYNTGKGIPEDELKRIWDVFYKVDKAHTRVNGGHGLGLSIVKSIIELHGGKVVAENKKGGIEFYIYI